MEAQQKGRALYVVLALVFAGLIVGGATWSFLSRDSVQKTAQTDEKSSETPASTTELQAATKTELDSSLTDLDAELASIELEEGSEDDTVDF